MRKYLFIVLFVTRLFPDIIHVSITGSDDIGDGTLQNPFQTVQKGIDISNDGDSVLISSGTYYENLILEKEIVLASYAIYDELDSTWLSSDYIHSTIINGAPSQSTTNNGSCLVIRDNNIQPIIKGLTFQDGVGTSISEIVCDVKQQKRSGGAILIYNAYPTIMFNRFIENGLFENTQDDILAYVTEGGAISHYDDAEVEFDEDRTRNINNNRTNRIRTVPTTMNIQNNYFENNSSGDGRDFFSNGYTGSIDLSYSQFANIECENIYMVNDYVLKSRDQNASYIQNGIQGQCINENVFYVSNNGDNSNEGTELSPLKTIGHALSLVKKYTSSITTIHLLDGVYSPSTNGEQFPIVIPNRVHLIGNNNENTILDAEASLSKQSRVLIIDKLSNNVKISNLTISGGYHITGGCVGGGGILVGPIDASQSINTSVTLENLIITNNYSHMGGGIFVSADAHAIINNCKIINNGIGNAPEGAFLIDPTGAGINFWYGSGEIHKTLISDNTNSTSREAGAVAYHTSVVSINRSTITKNINCAGVFGWTLYDDTGQYNPEVNIVNTLIHQNHGYDIAPLYVGDTTRVNIVHSVIGSLHPQGNFELGDGSFYATNEMVVTEEDGFTIPPNSVCVDAGISDIDGDGNEDIFDFIGNSPDIGAVELYSSVSGVEYSVVDSSLVISWDGVDGVWYYVIERSLDSLFNSDLNVNTTELNNLVITNIDFNTEYFFRITYLRNGFWSAYSETNSVTLNTLQNSVSTNSPIKFKINQNYPNPFNPMTQIRYDLPFTDHVNITIYDVMGRKIKSLLNMEQKAGYRSIEWNATNDLGQPVSAGMYIYTIQAGEFRQTKKMVLLK